ncbi:MAG TPA: hypothetical protein VKZ56_05530, partial [Membranihabitans sp.]|nr:hypothetical protein [Membranihabitans sp.]
MKSPWLVLIPLQWVAMILIAHGTILGQSTWSANSCGNHAPVLDRILIDACTAYEPDEYIIFHTGSSPLPVQSGNLSIRVYATSNPYVADQWTSNSSALSQMNQSANCGEPIFIDPFESPYQGVIPPNSNVLAFVQHSPNFTGTLSGLCERGAVFVLFGNYHDGFSSSMFGNSCTDCTRHIEIQLGTCNYDIVYEPELLTGGNGAFIEGNGGSISYGNSPGCKPSFHHFPTPPAPIPDRDNISICENETVATEAINITNGNSYTSWHLNPDGPPIHYGSSFVPDLTFFLLPTENMPTERSLYVANTEGGRRSTLKEIRLISNPAPATHGISLLCDPKQQCVLCGDENALLELSLSGLSDGLYYFNLTDGNNDHIFDFEGNRKHSLELPAAEQYWIQSVTNTYGCMETEGLGNAEVSIDIRSPAHNYLPTLPELCNNDEPYTLPEMPGEIPGNWLLGDNLVTTITPVMLGEGEFSLKYQPSDD